MTAPARLDLPDWPRLMPVPLAACYLGIGETTLRTQGPEPRRLGKRVLYDRQDLDRWADALGGQPLDEVSRDKEVEDALRRIEERLNGR